MHTSICLVALVGWAAVLLPTAGQEKPNQPEQFAQSVERPNRTWDYDCKRVLGHVGQKICLWDATTGQLLCKLEAHKEHIFAVRFSPDGRHALSSSWMGPGPMVEYKSKDTHTIVWDLQTGNTKAVWLHGGKDIKICDLGSGKIVTGAECGPYPLRAAIVSPDNRRLAVEWGGANDVEPGLGVYDMGTGREVARIKLAERGHVVGFSPGGKTLLVGGSEFVIYDSENGKKVRGLKLLDEVSFAHDWNQ